MRKTRLLSLVISAVMLFGSTVQAANFSDMPTDPAAAAVIENAVKNGILSGYIDGTVRPDAPITRAEMASIIARACGAVKEGDISRFVDVNANAWYYPWLSKAHYIGAFSGSYNMMYPDNNITFQECFTVLSQVFDLVPSYILERNFTGTELPANSVLVGNRIYYLNSISNFSDVSQVADWAKVYVAGVVEHGGWYGINNNLTPLANITRLQFATVMDNLIKNYIDTPGTYDSLPQGNTLVRCDGVVLNNIATEDDIFIADCVSGNGIKIENANLKGRLVVRGCATATVDNFGVITFTDYGISLTNGYFEQIRVIRPLINIDLRGSQYNIVYSVPGTNVAQNVNM
ncbi:MAG: S-layer homology domain-containing protein [Clostridia bacterium]|nr:S-layer homology domain-containing protein [Clostridia bacterium]